MKQDGYHSQEARQRERDLNRSPFAGPYWKCISEDAYELYQPGVYYASTLIKKDIKMGVAKPEWFREEHANGTK